MCSLVANIKPTDCEPSVSYYSSELLCACSYDLLLFFPNIGLCHMSERLVNSLWCNFVLHSVAKHATCFAVIPAWCHHQVADREGSCSCLEKAVSDSWQGVAHQLWDFSPQKGSMWGVFHRAPESIGFFEKTEKMDMSLYFPFPQKSCCVNTA